ncbi:MAG: hypothetical protein NXY59_07015 [Aigarchaeota archaeon]|nr:hypothetical protein [Candidatus Pelearchaeum maunauluense]
MIKPYRRGLRSLRGMLKGAIDLKQAQAFLKRLRGEWRLEEQ